MFVSCNFIFGNLIDCALNINIKLSLSLSLSLSGSVIIDERSIENDLRKVYGGSCLNNTNVLTTGS
jgi:hypothetical protein